MRIRVVRSVLVASSFGLGFLLYQNCGAGFSPISNSMNNSLVLPSSGTPPQNPNNPSFVMASHAAFPAVPYNGGRVLTAPKILPVFFSGDAMAASLTDFVQKYSKSSELYAVVSEYGGNLATYVNAANLSQAAPASLTDSDIQTFISAQFKASGSPIGMPDDQTIYTVYYPETTNLIDSSTSQSMCSEGALGYHSQFVDAASGKKIIYSVILRCSGYDALTDVTATTSHETVEAITDPDNFPTGYIFFQSSNVGNVWASVLAASVGEVGDMCEAFQSSNYTPSDLGYQIQRTWSNKAAAAGLDPCQPGHAADVYFNATAVVSDSVTYTDQNYGPLTTTGVKIAVGQSRTIPVKLFSSASTGGVWNLSAIDMTNSGTSLSFSFDKSTGQNGDVVNLTVTVQSQDSQYLAEPFLIVSDLNGVRNYWPVMVGN